MFYNVSFLKSKKNMIVENMKKFFFCLKSFLAIVCLNLLICFFVFFVENFFFSKLFYCCVLIVSFLILNLFSKLLLDYFFLENSLYIYIVSFLMLVGMIFL